MNVSAKFRFWNGACVEKHLHSARRQLHKSSGSAAPTSAPEFARNESFAELHRHDLSNPLTGIHPPRHHREQSRQQHQNQQNPHRSSHEQNRKFRSEMF
jgi:hypothetical protein